nr:uncharacterized protein LOC128673874 [Plodia interpunctella]
MKMVPTFLFLIFLTSSNADMDFQATMIADLVRSMERPSLVIATLCWPAYKKLKLYSMLDGWYQEWESFDLHLEKYAQMQSIVFLADLNCPNVSNHLQKSLEKKYFRSPYRWLILKTTESNKENKIVPEAIYDFDIFPDSEVMVIFPVGDTSDIYFIYRVGAGEAWKTEFYGTWDVQNKVRKSSAMFLSTALRRQDLSGHEISICYVLTDSDSINHLTDEVNDYIDTITKVNFPTTNHLLDFLNANRKYLFANTWGYHVNGTWDGMTGYLVREEVEIGGSPMFFTSERMSVVEYIASPTPTRSKFVFQQPKLSYENNLFLLSFKSAVWYSCIALVFIMLLAIFVVAVWEWKKHADTFDSRNKDAGVLRPSIADIVILIFGATCQQGSPVELKGLLGRIVMLILFLALMFLYTSYSANIVALLQSSSSKIKSLEDLLNSRIKFGVHDTVFNRYYFATATEPIRKAIYEKKVAPPGSKPRFMSMEEGVKLMQKGLFAFHMETGVGYKFVGKYFKESEKCGLKEIQYLQVIDPWLAVRRDTPYKEIFKIGLKRIQEHGLQYRENHLLYEKRPKCSGRGSSFISVSMVDCYPALLILSYGMAISLVLLFLEILYKRIKITKNLRLKRLKRNSSLEFCLNFYRSTMEMKIILLLVLASKSFLVTSFDSGVVKMVGDVINSYNKPASVIANVCWSSHSKLKLAAELGKNEAAKSIQYIDDNIDIERLNINANLFFIVDIECSTGEEFLKTANEANLFVGPNRWLFLSPPSNSSVVIPKVAANLKILPDAEVIICHFQDEVYMLNLIYKIKMANEDWHVEYYGNWEASGGLIKSMQMEVTTAMRRRNLERNVITTSLIAVDNRTKENLYDLRNVEIDVTTKANIRHIDVLYDFINATKAIKFTNTWGYFINGSWNGIVGHFVRGETDIGGTVMFINLERIRLLKFICHPTNIVVEFVFREPPLSYHSNLFLLPFTRTVWMCIAAFVLIFLFITYLNVYWESIKIDKEIMKEAPNHPALRANVSDIVVLLISAMCQQGSSIELKGGVGRLIMFLIFLSFLFLYTSYSASIVALLQSSSSHIRTLADLYNSGMELGIENLPYNIYYFTSAKDPLRKAIYQNRVAAKGRKPNILSIEEGVKRVQTSHFAFNMNLLAGYRLVNKYFHEHEKCGLQQMKYIEDNKPLITCAKHSPYVEIFKIGLQRGMEHGLFDRVNQIVYMKKPLCIVRGGSFISVTIRDFYPVLLMLLYGMILSVVILIIEVIVHRKYTQICSRFDNSLDN